MSILKNSINIFFTQVFVIALSLATYAIITRALGASVFGIYSLVVVFHALLMGIANLGFGYSNSSFAAKGRYTFGELHVNSIIVSVGIGLLLIPFYYLGAGVVGRLLLKGVDYPLPWVAVLAVPFGLYYSYIRGIWVGLEKISDFNRVELFRVAAWFSASVVSYVLFGGNVLAMLSAWLFSWLASSAVIFYLVCRKEPSPFRFNPASLKELTRFGFMISLGNLARVFRSRFGIFLVNYFLGTAAAGFFNLAVTLSEAMLLIPGTVMNAAASRVFGADPEESWRVVVDLARPILLILSGGAALAFIVSPVLIPLIYGAEYHLAVIPLMILLPGVVSLGLANIMRRYISGNLLLPEITTKLAWLVAGVNIFLSLILIPSMGLSGAALALAITYMVSLALVLAVLSRGYKKRVFELFYARGYLRQLLASLRSLRMVYK